MKDLNRFDRRDIVLEHKGAKWRLWVMEQPFCGAVAGVLTPDRGAAKGGNEQHMAAVFTRRPSFKREVSLAALRRAAGKVDWNDYPKKMLRQVGGVTFNMKLVARILAAVDGGFSKVRLEVAPFPANKMATTLRIITPDWIGIVASHKDSAQPLALLSEGKSHE